MKIINNNFCKNVKVKKYKQKADVDVKKGGLTEKNKHRGNVETLKIKNNICSKLGLNQRPLAFQANALPLSYSNEF